MPSRAVTRKKARKEAKKKKAETEKATIIEAAANAAKANHVVRPLTSVIGLATKEPSATSFVAVPPRVAVPLHSRTAVKFDPEPMPEGLTHKQRKKWESKQRLMKQMTRLANVSGVAAEGETAATSGVCLETTGATRERHDPRWSNGTFWRTRKERRARTLFLGGIPTRMSQQDIKDFILTLLDSDSRAKGYLQELGGADAVEDVDFLPLKHFTKLRHMYVTMRSVPIAECAALLLDGYRLEEQKLRCNFAADRSQRVIAIQRRGNQ